MFNLWFYILTHWNFTRMVQKVHVYGTEILHLLCKNIYTYCAEILHLLSIKWCVCCVKPYILNKSVFKRMVLFWNNQQIAWRDVYDVNSCRTPVLIYSKKKKEPLSKLVTMFPLQPADVSEFLPAGYSGNPFRNCRRSNSSASGDSLR